MLTQRRLREVLLYSQESGEFKWISPSSLALRPGQVAGTAHGGNDYVRLMVDGVRYKAHRLAWLYVHGQWPKHEIDHINGIKSDNRIANLRDVPKNINQQNHRKANAGNPTRLIGAVRHGKGFTASIRVEGRLLYLGKFPTAMEAHAVYLEAKRQLHAGCTL